MKNTLKLTLLLLLLLPFIGYSQYVDDGLKILNPSNNSWSKSPAHFDQIKMKVTPAGIYANVEIEMEVSAKYTAFASWNDSLEIEYKFSLPQGTLIHDAWLWMENIPVQARLYEKGKAKLIYEALVNRKVDPLIIYKNENGTYEARIFPILGIEARKVKFAFLVPVNSNSKAIELPLPLSMFRSDLTGAVPNIDIEIVNNSFWGAPQIWSQAINVSTIGNTTYATLPATKANINSINGLYFKNYSRDGFFITQETATDEGYYQIMLPAKDTVVEPQYIIFVVDYINSSNTSYQEVWNTLSTKIKYELNAKDSFNIIYTSNGNVQSAYTDWIPADSGTVAAVLNAMAINTSNDINLNDKVILKAIQFNNARQIKGSILLITNQKSPFNNVQQCNSKLNALIDSMQELMPVNIMNIESGHDYDFPVSNAYTENNDYFLSNLSLITDGLYFKRLYNVITNYYYSSRSLNDLFNICFNAIQPKNVFDQLDYNYTGILTDEYRIPFSIFSNQRNAYMEIGKYYLGTGPLQLQRTYKIDTVIHQDNYAFNAVNDTLNLTKKMWGGNLLSELEGANSNDLYTSEIISNSLAYNVLSTKTAFLAIEVDTVTYRVDNTPPTVGIKEKEGNSFKLIAIPNPFTDIQKVKINLTSTLQNKEWQMQICDISGRIVHTQTGNTANKDTLLISWDGRTLNGGIYLLTFQIDDQKTTIKIVKQ